MPNADYDIEELPLGYERGPDGKPQLVPEYLPRRLASNPPVSLNDNPHLWDKFLSVYENTGRVTAAVAAVGTTRQTLVNTIKENAEFRALLSEAHERYAGRLLAEYQRIAIEGETVPVYHDGQIVGTMQKRNHKFLEVLVRRADPEIRALLAPPKLGQTTTNVQVNASTSVTAIAQGGSTDDAVPRVDVRRLSAEQRRALRGAVQALRSGHAAVPGTEPAVPGPIDVLATEAHQDARGGPLGLPGVDGADLCGVGPGEPAGDD